MTRFSRSAPEKPGVPRAMISMSTSGASGTFLAWTRRIPSRPRTSGRVDEMRRSKRPGRRMRRVEHVGAVGRRDDDDALVGLEAVHLDEELVQRLLALVVPAAEARAAVATDRVDLVDEDDAGRVLLALLEEVAHAARADADEHLDEVGARDAEERHAGLARDGAREQRLAGARASPIISTPLGMRPPSRWNFFGSLRNAMISSTSSFASSMPATSANVTLFCESLACAPCDLPKLIALPPPACSWRMKRKNMTPMKIIGRSVTRVRRPEGRGVLLLEVDLGRGRVLASGRASVSSRSASSATGPTASLLDGPCVPSDPRAVNV